MQIKVYSYTCFSKFVRLMDHPVCSSIIQLLFIKIMALRFEENINEVYYIVNLF